MTLDLRRLAESIGSIDDDFGEDPDCSGSEGVDIRQLV